MGSDPNVWILAAIILAADVGVLIAILVSKSRNSTAKILSMILMTLTIVVHAINLYLIVNEIGYELAMSLDTASNVFSYAAYAMILIIGVVLILQKLNEKKKAQTGQNSEPE